VQQEQVQQQPGKQLTKHQLKMLKRKSLCQVCGDKSSGYHYGILSCEGCKAFFKRTTSKRLEYICQFSGNCNIDKSARKRCKACRMRRCREEKMNKQKVQKPEKSLI